MKNAKNTIKIKPIKKNNKTLKVVATSVLLAGLIGGSALAVGLYHENIKSWFNKQKTYSYDEVQEMLNENNQSWESKLKNLISNSDELKNQLTEITKAKLESDSKIANLENQIEVSNAEHQAKITELQKTIDTNSEEYQQRIEALNVKHAQEIETLQSQLEAEKNNNSDLSSQIESLKSQIVELNQKIAMYEELIQQYENDETAPVSFYDGEQLIKATLVSKGSTYSLDTSLIPANSETREFIGWAVDGVEVDSDTYEINKATVFTAVFKYKVNYVINGETTSLMIKQGTALSENAPEVTPGANQEFAGWVDSNGQAVDLTSTNVVAPTTITAQFNNVYNITFNYDDKSETIRLVNGEFESDVPTPTAPDGYRLSGWTTDNGFYDTTELKNITEDTTLTPKYIKLRYIKIKYRTSSSGTFTIWNSETFTLTCGFSLNSTGDVAYYILVNNQISAAISQIAKENGKANPNYKCLSLVENANPYLYSTNFDGKPPFHELDNSTEDVYIYLTLQ